ncbi:hypothetical protein [Burkholderia territorii]|uniref:hypothetical protein n=1 Tax=Burkholderia territorii TaxID=1503055 RepID=UPI000B0B846A|nr:hypothetical protein [Burkholderia territorii]
MTGTPPRGAGPTAGGGAAVFAQMRRETWELPLEVFAGDTPVVPLRAGETIGWKFA